jgi:hypothetical protein
MKLIIIGVGMKQYATINDDGPGVITPSLVVRAQ